MTQLQSTGSSVVASTGSVAVGSITVGGNVEGDITTGNYNLKVNNNHGTLLYTPAAPRVKLRDVRPQPPRPPRGFVDRAEELDQLNQMITAGDVVVLCGSDGVGKTALLKRAASGDAAYVKHGGVVMLESIDEQGEALGADDVIQRLFDALFESEPRLKVKVDADAVRTYLSNTQPLIALDGLNLPLSALARISDLFPKGALLITRARPVPDDIARMITVGPLPRTDALQLLAVKSRVWIDTSNRPILDALCALLGDTPLALVLTGNVIREKRMPLDQAQAVLVTAKPSASDDITACVQRAFALAHAALSQDEQQVLAVVAASPGVSVDLEWLRESLGLTVPVDTIVDHLKAVGLLHANSPRLRVDPGIRPIARLSIDEVTLKIRLIEYLKTAFQTRSLDWAFCADELGNALGAMEWAAAQQRWADVIALGRAIDAYLTLHGLWDAWRMALNHVLEAALQSGDRANEAWARHQLGTQMAGVGQIDQAIRQLRGALEIRRSLDDVTGTAYTQHNLDLLLPPTPPSQPSPPSTPPQPATPKPKSGSGFGCGISKIIVGGLLGITLCGLLCGTFLLWPRRIPPPTAVVISNDIPTSTETPVPTDTLTPPPMPTDTPTPTETPVPTDTPTPLPTLIIDTDKPVISELSVSTDLAYYGPGTTTCGSPIVTVGASISDASKLNEVQIVYRYEYEDGSSNQSWQKANVYDVSGGNYRADIDNNSNDQAASALKETNGYLHWQVQVMDEFGNQASDEQRVEIVYCAEVSVPPTDTTGPEMAGPSTVPNPAYYGDSGCGDSRVTFSVAVSDASRVTSVQVYYRYKGTATSGQWQIVDAGDIEGGIYVATIDTNANSEATNTLGGQNGFIHWYVMAYDEFGYNTDSQVFFTDPSIEIRYCDTTGPEISQPSAVPSPVYYGDSGCGDSHVTFSMMVNDPSGVKSVEFHYLYEGNITSGQDQYVYASYEGGVYVATIDTNASSEAINALGGQNGTIRWYVLAYDELGNKSDSKDFFGYDPTVGIQYCAPSKLIPDDLVGPAISGEYASSDPTFYGPSPQTCGASTVTLNTVVTDPSDVESVEIGYQYSDSDQWDQDAWIFVRASTDGSGVYSITVDHNDQNQAEADLKLEDGYFHWFVRAKDMLGNWTNGYAQILKVRYWARAAHNPLSPKGQVPCTPQVLLQWEAVSYPDGITGYKWELERSFGPNGPHNLYTSHSTLGTLAKSAVSCANWYRWRVQAIGKDDSEGDYSDWAYFSVGK